MKYVKKSSYKFDYSTKIIILFQTTILKNQNNRNDTENTAQKCGIGGRMRIFLEIVGELSQKINRK